jgi:hypothetical protein
VVLSHLNQKIVLDAAYQAMTAEGQKATAQRLAGHATPREASGVSTDFNA